MKMWLYSSWFQICLFVAYSVKNINNIEIRRRRYKTKTNDLKEIINRASHLLNKYYLLKSDYEEDLIVNDLKNRLKDAIIHLKEKINDPPQEASQINSLASIILNKIKNDNSLDQQTLKNPEYFYDDKPIWLTKNIKLSKDLGAFIERLLESKYSISIYKDSDGNIGKWLKTVLKKYFVPSIKLFALKPGSSKSNFTFYNNGDIFTVKYAKQDPENILTIDNLIKINNLKENQNADVVKSKISQAVKNETLRGGCIECTRVQLRRCSMALKGSMKSACKTYRCKSGFKTDFKSNTKFACLHEYQNGKKDNKTCEDAWKSNKTTPKPEPQPETDTQKRVRYFSYYNIRSSAEVCDNLLSLRETHFQDDPQYSLKNIAPMNILRDKYEVACEKALHKKCQIACSCAITITCDDNKCKKKQIKQMKKDCKDQCKSKFIKTRGLSDDDSDDDNDDDDDDDDDDDSDSSESDSDNDTKEKKDKKEKDKKKKKNKKKDKDSDKDSDEDSDKDKDEDSDDDSD